QFGKLAEKLINAGEEFVQRRIQQANSDGQSSHLTKDAEKISALQRQEFLEGFFARADAIGQNHFAHRSQSLIAKEHMFRATKANTFRAKATRDLGVAW